MTKLLLVLLGLVGAADAQATCAGGTVTTTVFDNLFVSSDCVIAADVTGRVEVSNGAHVTVNATIFGSLDLLSGTSAVVNGDVQGVVNGVGASSVTVATGGTVGSLTCLDCVEIAVQGCATSIDFQNPVDGILSLDCAASCFAGSCICPSSSPPSVSITGGTMSSVSIANCEPAPTASSQDLLITESTFTGSVAVSNAVLSDVLINKVACDAGVEVTIQDTATQSDVTLSESACAFVIGPNFDPSGDVAIGNVAAVTITGLATSEAVRLNGTGETGVQNSTFTGNVELKGSNNVTISNTCFLAGAGLINNAEVTCTNCFVGFSGITCDGNTALINGGGNTANPEKPDVIVGCGGFAFTTTGGSCPI